MDGWWVGIGAIAGTASDFNLFIDNSLAKTRRTIWYGASASKRKAVERIDHIARARWPHTQVHLDDPMYPTSQLRYSDPILDRWGQDEYYYGWYEREQPQTTKSPSGDLIGRIVERFTAILSELGEDDVAQNVPIRLDELDGLRQATVRLEQRILRKYLLAGRTSADCALCGERFPVDLMIAAHIKRRANCNDSERRNYANNLMAVCAFGCDDLFERGYIAVNRGRIIAGARRPPIGPVQTRVAELTGRGCLRWNARSAPFFTWHRTHSGKL
jgi:hypothetical protein